MPSTTTSIVVTDASVLLNFCITSHFALLGNLPHYRFVVTDEVIAEVVLPDERDALNAGIEQGILGIESISTPEELGVYSELSRRLGSGVSFRQRCVE